MQSEKFFLGPVEILIFAPHYLLNIALRYKSATKAPEFNSLLLFLRANVNLGTFLNLSKPCFPHLYNGDEGSPTL